MKYIHVLFQHYEELKVSIHIQLICSYKIEIDTTLQYHGYRGVKRTLLWQREPIYDSTDANGELNKSAVTISRCIHQHISNSTNQTTLDLAVKLHHKFGISELVKLLNEHGIVTTYDEVMQYRKSAANYISVNGGKFMRRSA